MRPIVFVAGLAIAAAALIAHQPAGGKPIALTGTVVDTGCYFGHGGSGEKHLVCATACAQAGVPLAILEDKTGALYLPVASDHKNPNTRLMPFVEKRVRIDGALILKGGMKGVVIKTVAAAQ